MGVIVTVSGDNGGSREVEYDDAERWFVDPDNNLEIRGGTNGGLIATYRNGFWFAARVQTKE